MPADTRTGRMHGIANELEYDGFYTAANSIMDITKERDELLERARALVDECKGDMTPSLGTLARLEDVVFRVWKASNGEH